MLGENTGKHVQADVPEGWQVQYHAGRMQPYTLRRAVNKKRGPQPGPNSRARPQQFETVRFCRTLAEAEVASGLPLDLSLKDLRQEVEATGK